jgi:hypothetical protein
MKTTVTRKEATLIVEKIFKEAEVEAKSENYIANRGEELAYILGYFKGQVTMMLEKGNESTIKRYLK